MAKHVIGWERGHNEGHQLWLSLANGNCIAVSAFKDATVFDSFEEAHAKYIEIKNGKGRGVWSQSMFVRYYSDQEYFKQLLKGANTK